jgi:hypothetical protein
MQFAMVQLLNANSRLVSAAHDTFQAAASNTTANIPGWHIISWKFPDKGATAFAIKIKY